MGLKKFYPKDISGPELRAIEFLAALDARLTDYSKPLEERLRKTKDGWRNYRVAVACMEKAIDAVYESVDNETRQHMRRLVGTSEVIIRPTARAAEVNLQTIDESHLKVLVNTSMSAECAMCLKEGTDVRKCALRKALLFAAPPSRIPDNGRCPFAEVALCHDLGKYME